MSKMQITLSKFNQNSFQTSNFTYVQLSLDSCIYRGLKLDASRSIEVTGIQISRSNFWASLMYLCRVSFLTTLDLYKAYFRGHHIRENTRRTYAKGD